MIACRWLLLLTLVFLSSGAIGAGRDGIMLTHFEPVDGFVIRDGRGDGIQKLTAGGPVQMSFDVLGRRFDLELEPNARLLAAIPLENRTTAMPYTGRIAGVADSWVRMVIADGVPSGMIWDGNEIIALEPPGNNIVNSPDLIGFRLADVVIEPGALSCATAGAVAMSGADAYKVIVDGVGDAFAPGAIDEIDIGVVADFEAFGVHGGSTEAAILTRISNVDGIYSQQVEVQINPFVDVFTDDASDPFTDENIAGDLLDEVASFRFGSQEQRGYGLTHLYTGRDLQGTTAGIAFVNVLCHPSAGAGLSEIGMSPTLDALVAAHEIGHNFGADHDGDPDKSCPDAPLTHIMAPSVSVANNTFSACSVGVMQASAAVASCVTPLPSTDISVSFAGSDTTALLSNAFQATANVVNRGTEDAINVVADVTLPGNVSLVDVTGATCTSGAGTVNCPLDTIAGGSAVAITISTDTVAVGAASFDVAVTADADDNPANNQDSVLLTVDPAVNLVIDTQPAAQVDLDQSTNVSVSLQNLSTLDATDVTLSVSLNAALQANSASLSIGSCTVAAQQVDCTASRFANQTSATFNINVTGLSAGNKGYTLTLASAEADADTSDNSFTGTVSVSDPRDDEGGGSLGWLFLGFLFGVRTLLGKRALIR